MPLPDHPEMIEILKLLGMHREKLKRQIHDPIDQHDRAHRDVLFGLKEAESILRIRLTRSRSKRRTFGEVRRMLESRLAEKQSKGRAKPKKIRRLQRAIR